MQAVILNVIGFFPDCAASDPAIRSADPEPCSLMQRHTIRSKQAAGSDGEQHSEELHPPWN